MHTTKPLTPPATGGVFRSPPLARAHVDCTDVQTVVRRDYLHNLLSLDHARARTPAKRGAAIQKPDAYYRKRWEAAKVPRRTFFHALKKVKDFLQADKHWAKSMSGGSRKRKSLHKIALLHPIGEGGCGHRRQAQQPRVTESGPAPLLGHPLRGLASLGGYPNPSGS